MLKYLETAVTFAEIPDEITLCINITNCPHRCKECHSPYLQENIGKELTEKVIDELASDNKHITCICLMGGDNDHKSVAKIASYIRSINLKSAMYSGDDELDENLIKCLDYYKIGSYNKILGPLNSKTTNQRLYIIDNNKLKDITYKFQNS